MPPTTTPQAPDPLKLAEACAAAIWAQDTASQGLGMVREAVGPGTAEERHLAGRSGLYDVRVTDQAGQI